MRCWHCKHGGTLMILVLWAFAMTGCEQKQINQIRAEPSRYANREVAVIGTVTRSISVLGKGAYEIEDQTGRLWVASAKGVPREGAQILVRGTIRDAFDLSSVVKLPQEVSSGLVMIERSHKAR
jgi:hypothetical protein